MLTLREMPPAERPRERLRTSGPNILADAELLAVLLGSGSKGRDALRVAHDLLAIIDGEWPNLKTTTLEEIPGVGAAKASLIVASLEFARRRIRPQGTKISGPADIMPLVQHLADRKQEHFICISLNGAHEVIASRVVTIGLVNSTQCHPREVFSDPICDRACAIVVAHNHPSGTLIPSEEDKLVTVSLKKAAEVLGIKLLDHVIFATRGYYSFADDGAL
jgi:DNA repair protein RadC